MTMTPVLYKYIVVYKLSDQRVEFIGTYGEICVFLDDHPELVFVSSMFDDPTGYYWGLNDPNGRDGRIHMTEYNKTFVISKKHPEYAGYIKRHNDDYWELYSDWITFHSP